MTLVPLSFQYVELDEIALKRHTIDNTVDIDKTYTNGRYFWGIDYETVTYPRRFQKVRETYSIFPTTGLEFNIDVVFWYQIQRENLGQLFKAFGKAFNSQVVNRANAKIKNVAPNFNLEEYVSHRPEITTTLYQSLVDDLKDIYIDLPYSMFWLGRVDIPIEIRERDLDAAVQNQRNIEEQNHQLATLVRKETDRQVEEITASINLIGLTAKAESDRLISEARAVSERVKETADGLGLKDLFFTLNVTSPGVKEKYIAYFALLDNLDEVSAKSLEADLNKSVMMALKK